VLSHPAFAACELDTGFIPRHEAQLLPAVAELPAEFWQLAAEAFVQSETSRQRDDDAHSPWTRNEGLRLGLPAEIDVHLLCQGERQVVRLRHDAQSQVRLQGEQLLVERDGVRRQHLAIRRGDTLYLQFGGELRSVQRADPIAEAQAGQQQHGGLTAPMNGSIVRVLVTAGQSVEAGTALVVLEAMKMEHSIRAPHTGTVKALYCSEGEMVGEGAVLVELEEA
jgi:3-methylcrotonyl-CoA carboxylase alpha subunit